MSPSGDGDDGGEGFGVVTDSAVELNAYEAAIGAAAEVTDRVLPYCYCVTIPSTMAMSLTMVSVNVMTE